MGIKKKFRGQEVEITNSTYMIQIRKPHVRRGEKVRIGLSDALIQAACQAKGKIRVVVPDRFLDITLPAWEWRARGVRLERKSHFKGGKPWFMWMVTILPQEWKQAERLEIESGIGVSEAPGRGFALS